MKRSRRYNGQTVSFDNARCRCSIHPTSSELNEPRRAAALILSETIRPRRVSRKRVGEDERDDLGLLLTEFVEYRRVRRPFWDMGVTDSEVWRSDHRDEQLSDRSQISHDRSRSSIPPLRLESERLTERPDPKTTLSDIGHAACTAVPLKFREIPQSPMIGYGMLSKRLKTEEPSYPVHFLYLPAPVQFGNGSDVRLPSFKYCHGRWDACRRPPKRRVVQVLTWTRTMIDIYHSLTPN